MLIPFTQSCLNDYDDDIYDIQAEMPFNAALATVVTPSEVPGEAVIESDNDGIAYVVNPDKLTRFETNNPGQRIFYTYINAANPTGDASKKGPFISIDIYGHDGINLITPIMGKTHLTLMFQILGFNSNIKHRISLVATEGTVPDANGYMAVELRHNAEGDRQEYPSPGYVSFPLLDVPGYKEGKLQGFKIKMNTINNGEETVTVSYNKSKSTNFPFIQKGISNTKTK